MIKKINLKKCKAFNYFTVRWSQNTVMLQCVCFQNICTWKQTDQCTSNKTDFFSFGASNVKDKSVFICSVINIDLQRCCLHWAYLCVINKPWVTSIWMRILTNTLRPGHTKLTVGSQETSAVYIVRDTEVHKPLPLIFTSLFTCSIYHSLP